MSNIALPTWNVSNSNIATPQASSNIATPQASRVYYGADAESAAESYARYEGERDPECIKEYLDGPKTLYVRPTCGGAVTKVMVYAEAAVRYYAHEEP